MDTRKFKNWCDAAVDGIIFPPDRKQVHGELMDHLLDHYDDLVSRGMDPETAQQAALEAMGSAREIAPQLAAIHRPFWGYVYRATKVLLVLCLCTALVCGGVRLLRLDYFDLEEPRYQLHPFRDTQVELGSSTHTRIFYAEPNLSRQSDGYTITLTRAALWQAEHREPTVEENLNFYFQMEVTNPRPWAEFSDIPRWIRAVDSLGNTYDCFNEGITNYAPYIAGNGYHTGPLTYTHDMWISPYCSQDAEWIEFYYDRDGRMLTFRLDLTGGDAA